MTARGSLVGPSDTIALMLRDHRKRVLCGTNMDRVGATPEQRMVAVAHRRGRMRMASDSGGRKKYSRVR